MYGPAISFRIWLEKFLTGDSTVSLFENLKHSLKITINELDRHGVRFRKKYINEVQFENMLDNAIFHCMYNKDTAKEKASDQGTCIVNYFIDVINVIVGQIFEETLLLLQDEGYQIDSIRNIDDFRKLKLSDETKLDELIRLINNFIMNVIEFLSNEKFNKIVTFSKIKKAIVTSTDRIRHIETLNRGIVKDAYINKYNNNKQLTVNI